MARSLNSRPNKVEQFDHYTFNKLCQGVLVSNSVEFGKEIQVCFLFKFSKEIQKNMKQKQMCLQLVSFEDKSLETTINQGLKEPNLKVDISLQIETI